MATSEEIVAAVKRRLLEEPSCPVAGLAPDYAADPVGAGLIVLADPVRGRCCPAFQFDDGGRLRPVVERINQTLKAPLDPWGVADWWLGGNTHLGGRRPADLLGQNDDLLVGIAEALVEEC
jgi:hypothetical protein